MRVWAGYAAASFASALLPGFLLGGLLFALRLPGDGRLWEAAAGQAHGHLQVFGWAGLMVLGVGMHFLPRLRGVPAVNSILATTALVLLASGLLLRAISQPLVAGASLSDLGRAGLALSGALELGGASAALLGIARRLGRASARGKPGGFRQVAPFLLVAGAGYWLANLANLLAVAGAARDSQAFVTDWSRTTVLLGFYGFLVPISLGMSIRLFPLYIQAFPARIRLLAVSLALLEVGLVLRALAAERAVADLEALGKLLQAGALLAAIAGTRVFGPRRQLPRRQVRPLVDPIQLHVISAYSWLAVVAAMLALSGLGHFALESRGVPDDAEAHALGAGFITVLILGVGSHLLPGFASIRLRSQSLVWVILLLAQLAVLLRLAPELPGDLPERAGSLAGALAGISGTAAVMLFAWNTGLGRSWIWMPPEPGR